MCIRDSPMNRVISHYFPVHNALGQKKNKGSARANPKKGSEYALIAWSLRTRTRARIATGTGIRTAIVRLGTRARIVTRTRSIARCNRSRGRQSTGRLPRVLVVVRIASIALLLLLILRSQRVHGSIHIIRCGLQIRYRLVNGISIGTVCLLYTSRCV